MHSSRYGYSVVPASLELMHYNNVNYMRRNDGAIILIVDDDPFIAINIEDMISLQITENRIAAWLAI